jgi:hypothetical protein
MGYEQVPVVTWRGPRRRALSVCLVALVCVGVLMPSPGAAQWGRRGPVIGQGYGGAAYGGGAAGGYGAGYPAAAPAYGGYPPA